MTPMSIAYALALFIHGPGVLAIASIFHSYPPDIHPRLYRYGVPALAGAMLSCAPVMVHLIFDRSDGWETVSWLSFYFFFQAVGWLTVWIGWYRMRLYKVSWSASR